QRAVVRVAADGGDAACHRALRLLLDAEVERRLHCECAAQRLRIVLEEICELVSHVRDEVRRSHAGLRAERVVQSTENRLLMLGLQRRGARTQAGAAAAAEERVD